MSKTRPFGATSLIVGLGQGLMLVPAWLRMDPASAEARCHERRFMARVARRMLDPIRVEGGASSCPGTLYVANHISWLDIVLLGSILDANFVSKDDVSVWPLIGTLARRTATLFVERGRRGEARRQVDAIAERLQAGGRLILFAEGTTSDGRAILPFRSSLFAAASFASRIQPVALAYKRQDGVPLSDGDQDIVGWVGEETLVGNATEVARMRLSASVRLLESFTPDPTASRREVAERCRNAIAASHAEMMKPFRSS